ncbi:MAG TPA: geranylgeranylglyceryl/heptaprenylglyceryl phosphate synthase [Candidatus Marinimicrobia bacterium]|jgi:putative glycerol-1-phosphate prenyltransferase|nr:geranylgeranylglyceryl/heptaprenylglyceryl phosphate synthase [Candidatus Neomarinimicrobiota bacterium]MDP6229797.1 geranylgeranylglyceryl/heptaprenylglyceryl phosphate synthase [Candidatus Neomarinimicrobiota bacterium]MDP7094714.1 geranylgeranylglyceryl/heptaprenylglyceryl phosphate synthase [Candidatus Neomarinimicrobiota bacterium]MDP7165230.1 geranylgeranylglyceryl/heptaprenylglyceryl phosphate synthase [Candidatus Neomarinimicrobiota bacterium]MDP7512919.1 geranylgeranylglyceryl/hepta|tara:strand:- start:1259 stop:2011 length:753 start_codon:yes stop_codon:yes gene_type:complete
MDSVFQHLLDIKAEKGAGYIVLIDPDKKNDESLINQVETANKSGVDALFVGGSLMMDSHHHDRVKQIKKHSDIPVIFFPGGVNQMNSHYDAMLFMSLLSGRNPQYLIGEQVVAAPIVKDMGMEVIPTAYLLFDGGAHSTVEVISGTRPLPMNRPDIAIAHALAAEFMGKKLIYLEAGSGATKAIFTDVIRSISSETNVPLIVGGGIKTPEAANKRVEAGASYIVTGTVLEENGDSGLMRAFADAVHGGKR